jgi:hypothetical protein
LGGYIIAIIFLLIFIIGSITSYIYRFRNQQGIQRRKLYIVRSIITLIIPFGVLTTVIYSMLGFAPAPAFVLFFVVFVIISLIVPFIDYFINK